MVLGILFNLLILYVICSLCSLFTPQIIKFIFETLFKNTIGGIPVIGPMFKGIGFIGGGIGKGVGGIGKGIGKGIKKIF